MAIIKPGSYKHFKGFICEVIGVAKHSETQEELVVYRHDGQLWVRPVGMFLENVRRDGKVIPRFECLGEEKLVRDNIPEIIRAEGREPEVRIASQEEYKYFVKAKLCEEADEFAEHPTAEELADILEVVAAAGEAFGIGNEDLERVMMEKHMKRGGFGKRFILKI